MPGQRPDSMEAPAWVLRMSEREWQSLVVEAAQTFGWLVIHVRQMVGNEPGIPDLLMYRGDRYVAAELKTEHGKVSLKQAAWHDRMAAHGGYVHVWKPSDWDRVVEVLR